MIGSHVSFFANRGFSLLELIAVLIIASVLAITVIPRFSIGDNELLEAKTTVLSALRHSREVALARAQTNTAVRFIATATSIDVREGSVSVQFPNASYPITLPSGIRIQRGSGIITFDKLGNTAETMVEISNGAETETITVTGSGYVY